MERLDAGVVCGRFLLGISKGTDVDVDEIHALDGVERLPRNLIRGWRCASSRLVACIVMCVWKGVLESATAGVRTRSDAMRCGALGLCGGAANGRRKASELLL